MRWTSTEQKNCWHDWCFFFILNSLYFGLWVWGGESTSPLLFLKGEYMRIIRALFRFYSELIVAGLSGLIYILFDGEEVTEIFCKREKEKIFISYEIKS